MLDIVRRCRVVLGVLILLYLGLSSTPQAMDLLIALGQDGSPVAWASLAGGTAWLGLNAWFWTGFALTRGAPPRRRRAAAAMPCVLAAASLLGIADVLRAAAVDIPPGMGFLGGGGGRLVVASATLGVASFLLLLAALRAFLLGDRAETRPYAAAPFLGRPARRMLTLSVAVGVAGLVGFGVDPVRSASVLQPATTVLFAAVGMMCGGTLLLYLGQRTRVPLLFLVFAFAAILAALRDRGLVADNHEVRHLQSGVGGRPDVESAFLSFLDAGDLPTGRPIPVVLVAASGGGIAAAYWTATVLGDLADASPAFAGRVFAMSGVSGGGLGLLAFAAADKAAAGCRDPAAQRGVPRPTGRRACLQLAMGGDFLGPAVGAMLYPDLFQRFLPVPVFADRASALEAAWESRWQAVFGNDRLSRPFLSLWPPARPWPALLLNGTSLNSGGRLVTSNLALGAAHVGGDGADLLTLLGADVPVSTAASSGARFPFVSPFGTFHAADGTADAVADGGYFENLGASTLLELLDALDGTAKRHGRHVRFLVLQLVSDPNAGPATAATAVSETPWSLLPRGLTGPATVLLRTRDARGVSASEALARRVLSLGGAYIPARLGQSPTGRTAPLGWSLSGVARKVIDEQWTSRCRDRVLAEAGFRADRGQLRVAPPSTVPTEPMRMDIMSMWRGATCRALDHGS